jgi:hypothetical protein
MGSGAVSQVVRELLVQFESSYPHQYKLPELFGQAGNCLHFFVLSCFGSNPVWCLPINERLRSGVKPGIITP